jgi:anti-sigma factor RsiW
MNHEELQDLLESYVDETLDRTTRAEVDRHLAGCDNCRAILDGVPAVHLGAIERVAFDDWAMGRLVRVTLL